MRILGIAGSLRAGSHNRQLLRLAAETLPDGVELAVWEGLRDCLRSTRTTEGTPSVAVAGFRSAVAAADAVLIATPEYNGSIPGALKNALDWGSRPAGDERVPRQAGGGDRREPRLVRRRLGARGDAQGARPDGRPRRRRRSSRSARRRSTRGAGRGAPRAAARSVEMLVSEAAARAAAA